MASVPGWFAVVLILFSPVGAVAQDQVCIVVKVTAETVQQAADSRGRKTKQLLPADKVNRGEVVLYTARATNVCDRPVEGAAIAIPVPEHMTYVANSAVGPGARVTFSIDGGFNFNAPERLTFAAAGGERTAPPRQYTHIRWVMSKPLKPGAVALARFRAVFER